MILKKLLGASFLFSIVFSASAQTDSCSTLADLTSKSNPNTFVGFRAGTTQKEADDNAYLDLASRIRQKVSTISTVTENNTSSNLETTSKSVVSESLIGAKVLKRCHNGETFSSVVTLDQALFVSSLETKLSLNISQAEKLITALNSSKNDEIIVQNVDKANKLISNYQVNFENDLQLCKIYKGCTNIKNQNIFSDLVTLVEKQESKAQYYLETDNNAATENFKDELITILEKHGIKVVDSLAKKNTNSSSTRKINAKCNTKIGTKIPGSTDKVITVNCILNSKQKNFRRVYSCKAVLDTTDTSMNADDVIQSCSGRLKLED